MTDAASIRNIGKESRVRLAGEKGSEKEIAVMLGALTEAVLLLAEAQPKWTEAEILDLDSAGIMPCREEDD